MANSPSRGVHCPAYTCTTRSLEIVTDYLKGKRKKKLCYVSGQVSSSGVTRCSSIESNRRCGMTVQELIKKLEAIPDKRIPVVLKETRDATGTGRDIMFAVDIVNPRWHPGDVVDDSDRVVIIYPRR
jgi:hypothetical protein